MAPVADQAPERQPLRERPGLPAVGGLAGGQQEAQGSAEAIDQGVDLGRQPAARAAERLLAAAGRVALRLARAGIEHHGLEGVGRDAPEEEIVPDPLARPPPEPPVGRPRLAERGREILPRDAGAVNVDHRLDEPAQGGDVGLPDPGDGDELGVERRPCGVAQAVSGHRWSVSRWPDGPRTWSGIATALPNPESVSRP